MSLAKDPKNMSKKRKRGEKQRINDQDRNQDNRETAVSLLAPHEAIVAELSPKYDILTASVISSTQIRKRVTYATTHLLSKASSQPRVVLLYARTEDAAKLITIVELAKRVLAEEGQAWHQHNQLFEVPKVTRKEDKRSDVVEETFLEQSAEAEEDEESDDFEVMETRFEKAVLPAKPARVKKSLRVFLSTVAVPELKQKDGITVQTSEKGKA